MKHRKKRVPRRPEPAHDEDTGQHFRVPLATPGAAAIIDAETKQQWDAAGLSWQWGLNVRGYVCMTVRGKGPVAVSRVIAGATEEERVSFIDGDKLNLTLANLHVTAKAAPKDTTQSFMAQQAARRRAREASQPQSR